MSEPIKHTLFSFTKLRGAELISEEIASNFFIYHPDELSGTFFGALPGYPPGTSRRDYFLGIAGGFPVSLTTTDAVKALSPTMYAFTRPLYRLHQRSFLWLEKVTANLSKAVMADGTRTNPSLTVL